MTLRMFVAADLSEALIEESWSVLERAREVLDPQLSSRALRWVGREQLHLTLRFLGSRDAAEIAALSEALSRVGERTGPVELRLGALGQFGGRRARVVWVGLEGDLEGLNGLADAVDAELMQAGVKLEARAFRPHLTLARVRRGKSMPSDLGGMLAELGRSSAADATGSVGSVSLVQSTLTPGGARYRCLSRAALVGR